MLGPSERAPGLAAAGPRPACARRGGARPSPSSPPYPSWKAHAAAPQRRHVLCKNSTPFLAPGRPQGALCSHPGRAGTGLQGPRRLVTGSGLGDKPLRLRPLQRPGRCGSRAHAARPSGLAGLWLPLLPLEPRALVLAEPGALVQVPLGRARLAAHDVRGVDGLGELVLEKEGREVLLGEVCSGTCTAPAPRPPACAVELLPRRSPTSNAHPKGMPGRLHALTLMGLSSTMSCSQPCHSGGTSAGERSGVRSAYWTHRLRPGCVQSQRKGQGFLGVCVCAM